MATFLLTIGIVGLAMLGLAVGVIFKKRTPLKGSCGSVVPAAGGSVLDETPQTCETCSCHAPQNSK